MIGILDYGMGNLASAYNGFRKVGYEAKVISSPEAIKSLSGLVFPGVGSFGDAMAHLEETGMRAALLDFLDSGRPFLGLCLGMQLLFTSSEEGGEHRGLDVLPGIVKRLSGDIKVPHMGWNIVDQTQAGNPIFRDIPNKSRFYFVHSYYCVPEDEKLAAASTPHGDSFVSSVFRDNIWAMQFHPEKSSSVGLVLLDNFGRICEGRGGES